MRSGLKSYLRLGGILLAVWLAGRFLLPLTGPFLLGTALALAAEPMARFFRSRLGLPRTAASGIAVTMAFCFLGALGLMVCALLVRELRALSGILPELAQTASSGLNVLERTLVELGGRLPGELGAAAQSSIASLFSSGSSLPEKAAGYLLGLAGAFLTRIPDSFLGVGTAIISGYMISAKLPRLRTRLLRLLPREKLQSILRALRQLKATALAYLKAQLKLTGVTFLLLLAGLLLLRTDHAPAWAAGICLVDAFPILGTGTVLLPWAAVCALQGSTARALGLVGIYTVICVTRSALENAASICSCVLTTESLVCDKPDPAADAAMAAAAAQGGMY